MKEITIPKYEYDGLKIYEYLSQWLKNGHHDCGKELPHADRWKRDWEILEHYPYATVVYTDRQKETSATNFFADAFNHYSYHWLCDAVYDEWFGHVERRYRIHRDNKVALKLRNRITGQIVYLGWYDGSITVSEIPAKQIYDYKPTTCFQE